VAHLSQRLFLETSTNSSNTLSFSSQLRACIAVNSSMPDQKLPSPWVTFSQSPLCQRELSSQMLRLSKETVELLPELLELLPSSLVTLRMERRPVSDFHLELESPSNPPAEEWLEFALEVQELISHSLRPTEPTSRPTPRRETGQELEVLL